MYYLKYRPHTIDEIDNTKAKEIITKILSSKSLPHAFLFVGQKGTGKTSTARIFAKTVNCINRQTINPCNHCKNCLSIDTSSSPDVIELDAASNRGINEIKNLIKEASFLPMGGKYRIFIIDEAHMITGDGFNALLKTLEEPPDTVIFILATTNLEKLPKTISSRCFMVNFGKAIKSDVKNMLKRIITHEKLVIEDKLIDLITSHSEKSFRDAAKLLEELVIQNKLNIDDAKNYLGIRSKESLLEVIASKNIKDSLVWIGEFSQIGGNIKILIEELLEELRMLLLKKSGLKIDDALDVNFTLSEITFLMKSFNEAYSLLKNTPIDTLPLEIAVVEFYNNKILNLKTENSKPQLKSKSLDK